MSKIILFEKLEQLHLPHWYVPANSIMTQNDIKNLFLQLYKKKKTEIHKFKSLLNTKLWNAYKRNFYTHFGDATYIPALDYTMFMFEIVLPFLEPVFKAFNLEITLDKQNKTLIVTTPYFTGKPVKEKVKLKLDHQPVKKAVKTNHQVYYQWNIYYRATSRKNSIDAFHLDFYTLVKAPEPKIPTDRIKPLFLRDINIFTHELIHLIFRLVNWKTPVIIKKRFFNNPAKMLKLLLMLDIFDEALAYTYEYLGPLLIARDIVPPGELHDFVVLDQLQVLLYKTVSLLTKPARYKKLKRMQEIRQNPLKVVEHNRKLRTQLQTGVFYALFNAIEILASAWGGTALSYYLMIHKQEKDWWYFRKDGGKDGGFQLQKAIKQLKKHILEVKNDPNYLTKYEDLVTLIYNVL